MDFNRDRSGGGSGGYGDKRGGYGRGGYGGGQDGGYRQSGGYYGDRSGGGNGGGYRKRDRDDDYHSRGGYGGRGDYHGGRGGGRYFDHGGSGGGYGGGGGGGFGGGADRGGRGFGGGGRGYGGGGDRGGGRGGRGGRGGARHMGELQQIAELAKNHPAMNDNACLEIIDVDIAERARRSELVDVEVGLYPSVSEWRYQQRAGIALNPQVHKELKDHVVRCNFFRINHNRLPETIYLYDINIHRLQEGTDRPHDYYGERKEQKTSSPTSQSVEVSATVTEEVKSKEQKIRTDIKVGGFDIGKDLSKEKDYEFNMKIVREVQQKIPQWRSVVAAYDGGSALYTCEPLYMPEESEMKDAQLLKAAQDVEQQVKMNVDGDEEEGEEIEVGSSVDAKETGRKTERTRLMHWETVCFGRRKFAVRFLQVKVVDVSKILESPADDSSASLSAAANTSSVLSADQRAKMIEEHRGSMMVVEQALNVALFAFARWAATCNNPDWILSGNKVFQAGGPKYEWSSQFMGMLGYHASLKHCLSGLTVVKDISVQCFLRSGDLLDILSSMTGADIGDESIRFDRRSDARGKRELDKKIRSYEDLLHNVRVRLVHLDMKKEFRGFGPAADSEDSKFELEGVGAMTVEQYFEYQTRNDPKHRYRVIQYPSLPTVNVSRIKRKPLYVPIELIEILPGQTRQRSITGDISAKIIKEAAMVPKDRMRHISGENDEIFKALRSDEVSNRFGISEFAKKPIRVQGVVLPPAKLQYGDRNIAPMLTGAWNLAGGAKFLRPPPRDPKDFDYLYAVVYVQNPNAGNFERSKPMLQSFAQQLEAESVRVGIPLTMAYSDIASTTNDVESLKSVFSHCLQVGAIIVVAVLQDSSFYSAVKFAGDSCCLPTQCVQLMKLQRCPKGYHTNLLIKMNYKMGGINRCLASRLGSNATDGDDAYQQPAKSLPWQCDEVTMIMGVDVTYPTDFGAAMTGSSVIAAVASMDRHFGQYSTYITAGESRQEIEKIPSTTDVVPALQQAVKELCSEFYRRNENTYPRHLIVYRDGVADNQFRELLQNELPAYRTALSELNVTADQCFITLVVCQKRHHTRFFYENTSAGTDQLNPCVGLCVDAGSAQSDGVRGRLGVWKHKEDEMTAAAAGISEDDSDPIGCIVSPNYNEFYLNSHAASLGTSKPTKYVLLRDEIGFTMPELQLLTFWLTHLYGRCTKSASYATPAYYAHWAARRGGYLLKGGCEPSALKHMSTKWFDPAHGGQSRSMYFI